MCHGHDDAPAALCGAAGWASLGGMCFYLVAFGLGAAGEHRKQHTSSRSSRSSKSSTTTTITTAATTRAAPGRHQCYAML